MKKKTKIICVLIVIAIIVVVSIYNIDFVKKVYKYLKKFNWAFIITFLTLIYTIFNDSKERNKSIESATLSSNQLEFEKELFSILEVYDDLISESSTMFFDVTMDSKFMIPFDTIYKFKDMPIIYKLKLEKMKDSIYYFYREVECDHPCLDDLINDIESLNKKLNIELKKFMSLAIDALKIDKTIFSTEMGEKYKEINKRRTEINSKMIKLISDKKESIYKNARLCIRERMKIIKEKGI